MACVLPPVCQSRQSNQ